MNWKGSCSGGYWLDVEITEDSDLPKVFMDLTPDMWRIGPDNLEAFKKQHGITYVNEWHMGPCGRHIYTIKDNVFTWGKFGGFEPPLEKEKV